MAGGLDHLVVVARDLDAQAELYRRLGFQVGARNRHDWGTLNHIVQFDGSFLELLTTEAGFQRPAHGAPVGLFVDTDRRLSGGARRLGDDGARRVSMRRADHRSVSTRPGSVRRRPFYFARQGYRPDGEAVEVAFSLALRAGCRDTKTPAFSCASSMRRKCSGIRRFRCMKTGRQALRGSFLPVPRRTSADIFRSLYRCCGSAMGEGGLRFRLARGAVDVLTPAHCGWGCLAQLPAGES